MFRSRRAAEPIMKACPPTFRIDLKEFNIGCDIGNARQEGLRQDADPAGCGIEERWIVAECLVLDTQRPIDHVLQLGLRHQP